MRAIFLPVVAIFLAAAQQATACTCGRDLDAPPAGSEAAVTASLADSDAVFTARVISMESRLFLYLRIPRYLFLTRGDRELSPEEESRFFRRRVRLKVEQSFAGKARGEVALYTGWGGGDCGYEFQEGSRYLVYANTSGSQLVTSICSDTKSVEKATSELAFLQRIKKLQGR